MSLTGSGPTDAAGRLLYKEARYRADAVRHGISQMDDRVQGIIRFNVLALGLFVTGLSILLEGGSTGTGAIFATFIIGFAGFIISTVAAVSAYLKKGMAAGIDIRSLAEAFAYDVTESEIRTELVHAYRLAVANDEEVLEEASHRFRLSLYALIVGLVALLAGTTRFLSLGGGYS